MSRWAPKLGDVVTLASSPQQPMTVIGFQKEKDFYDVLWLNEQGGANGIGVPSHALREVKDEPVPSAPDPRASVEWQQMAEAAQQAATYAQEIGELKKSHAKCVFAGSRVLDQVRGDDTPDVIVMQLVERIETIKREANQQIEKLAMRIKELGG